MDSFHGLCWLHHAYLEVFRLVPELCNSNSYNNTVKNLRGRKGHGDVSFSFCCVVTADAAGYLRTDGSILLLTLEFTLVFHCKLLAATLC